MYLRSVHAESSIPVLRQLIFDNPLGVLTTAIRNTPGKYPTILASHIPWEFVIQDHASQTELGTLRGHLARPNPQSKAMVEHIESRGLPNGSYLEEEVLVLFTAQAHHYVTPKFYVETKPSTGKVVPTWNYAAVQAYGRAKVWFDSKAPETGQFLSKQIRALSQHAERSVMGYEEPWKVDDAPESYIELLQKAIIGIEIKVDRLEGKFKMSQEMGVKDREGVANGFKSLDSTTAQQISETVKERSDMKEKSKAK